VFAGPCEFTRACARTGAVCVCVLKGAAPADDAHGGAEGQGAQGQQARDCVANEKYKTNIQNTKMQNKNIKSIGPRIHLSISISFLQEQFDFASLQ